MPIVGANPGGETNSPSELRRGGEGGAGGMTTAPLYYLAFGYMARRRLGAMDVPLIRGGWRSSACSSAQIATCVRLEHGTLRRIAFMWTLTVASVIPNARAMVLLDWPLIRPSMICLSRSESDGIAAVAASHHCARSPRAVRARDRRHGGRRAQDQVQTIRSSACAR